MDQLDLRPAFAANAIRDASLEKQLLARRQRLQSAMSGAPSADGLAGLLREVDSALERMKDGTFGICETCHDTIESDRLLIDPFCRNCLDHLSPAEQRALEHDLDLAFQIQSGLLPRAGTAIDGWSVAYHYEPAGPVSGDYCDLIAQEEGEALFVVGDVTGKGVAASMLMAQLYAIFRSLAVSNQSAGALLAKANRIFCGGTPASHFATVVCGRCGQDGQVEICNAGHCLPLHVRAGTVVAIPSTGLPLGLFAEADYEIRELTLEKGDGLVLHSDGLTEAFDAAGQQYGARRLTALLERNAVGEPAELLAAILDDLKRFRGGAPRSDDLTVMVLRRND